MPILQADLTEASIITEGDLPCTIVSATPQMSKSSGKPMLVVQANIEFKGRIIPRTAYVSTTGKGAFQFKKFLIATGHSDLANALERAANGNGEAPEIDSDIFEGATCYARIVHELYEGNTQDKIDSFVPAP